MKSLSFHESSAKWLYLFLPLFCLFVWWTYADNIDLEIAWQGFSPVHWVYQISNPVNFTRDFPSGVENLKSSAFMHIYLLAYNYLGIKPESLLPFIMGFEILLLAGAVFVLSRKIFPNSHPAVPVLAVILVIASYARYMNLALWAQPYFVGKYNNVADALRIFAIVMALKSRYLFAWALLTCAFIIHPVMGLTACLFVGAMLAVEPSKSARSGWLVGGILFSAVAFLWVFSTFEVSSFSGGSIPKETWIKLTMLNSFHWYPVEFGIFTGRYQVVFLKFLSFWLLLLFYFRGLNPLRDMDRKLMAGMLSMMILVILGVSFPYGRFIRRSSSCTCTGQMSWLSLSG